MMIHCNERFQLTAAGEIHGVSDGVVAVYAQCNQHECGWVSHQGLWATKIVVLTTVHINNIFN